MLLLPAVTSLGEDCEHICIGVVPNTYRINSELIVESVELDYNTGDENDILAFELDCAITSVSFSPDDYSQATIPACGARKVGG